MLHPQPVKLKTTQTMIALVVKNSDYTFDNTFHTKTETHAKIINHNSKNSTYKKTDTQTE